ncbi:MAG TPA: NADH-quinone oxidoreductase subunit M [Polyangiales bacterium]|nr:NADH-quinone oxidoreductase subunit M [Polyangiales bacterium]
MSAHLISLLLGIPLFAGLAVMFLPRQNVQTIRVFTVGAMLIDLVLSLGLLEADYNTGAFQFPERASLVDAYGIQYLVGVDGISLWLVLLTTLIMPIATYASWTHIETKVKEYALSLLLLECFMLGAFVALDLFVFYVFWELMLIPMVLIIGVWGGADRVYAAVKFFLYTMVGSLLMLVAIIYLVAQYKAETGHYSFALGDLKLLLLPISAQLWLFSAFALAFAIKVPMFPFHTWLPDAHVQAPTGGSVILAAVLLKMGTYGFLRFAMPLFPAASHRLGATIAAFAVIGIIYGAYCAWVQKDVKKLVAYSSVSHLGFVMLGMYSVTTHGISGSILQMVSHGISTGALFLLVGVIYGAYCAWVQRDVKKLVAYSSVSHLGFVMLGMYSITLHGISGSILQMVSHGISTGALFLLVGVIYERRHTRELGEFGGLAKSMPAYCTLFVIVAMSSVGLPATNGFVGEFMILAGSFMSEFLGSHGPVAALFAATGVILAAVYMLHAVLRMFWGPLTNPENEGLPDLTRREGLALAPLIMLIFYIGLFPGRMLGDMNASVEQLQREYTLKLKASDHHPDSRDLLVAGVEAQ